MVVYIRKVKKSESKSQPKAGDILDGFGLCISVKLKNLKANHNKYLFKANKKLGCVYP